MLHFQDREDQAQPNDAHSTPRIAFLFAIYFAILGPFLGPNICISYGSEIIGKIVPGLTEVMPALLMFELLIASTISVHFLHIYGRKLHALAGSSACTVCLLIVTTGYFIQTNHLVLTQLLIVFGLLGYLFCFGMTFSPVIWMYIPEVVQPRLVGYAVMGNWLGAALMVILFPMVIEILPNHNSGYVFMAFAIYGMTSLFVINKLMVETKGKKSIDILHEYQELNK